MDERGASGAVEESEPRQIERQVLGGHSTEWAEPLLDAAMEGVDVLDVVRPQLVHTARNLPHHDPQRLPGGGPSAAPMVAALGTEGSTVMKLLRDPRATAVRTATCSREMPRLLARVPRRWDGLGIPLFWPLYERRKNSLFRMATPLRQRVGSPTTNTDL